MLYYQHCVFMGELFTIFQHMQCTFINTAELLCHLQNPRHFIFCHRLRLFKLVYFPWIARKGFPLHFIPFLSDLKSNICKWLVLVNKQGSLTFLIEGGSISTADLLVLTGLESAGHFFSFSKQPSKDEEVSCTDTSSLVFEFPGIKFVGSWSRTQDLSIIRPILLTTRQLQKRSRTF